jgi:hypothetical protein
MKRELYWLGGIGLGAGLMYWFDPDRGRHRRTHTRAQLLSARHRVENLVADATPDWRHLHLPRQYQSRLMQPFQRQRQRQPMGVDTVLLALGGLGVSAALAWMVRSRNPSSRSGEAASEAPLQAIGDWACGAWDGIRTWFRPTIEATNPTAPSYERDREVTMMGVEAESTKDAERQ